MITSHFLSIVIRQRLGCPLLCIDTAKDKSDINVYLGGPSLGEDNLPIKADRSQANTMSQRINNFLPNNTQLPGQKIDPNTCRPSRSAIRAVVLSGNASPRGFEFTELCDGPTIDSLDPAYVLAYGDARMAKQSIIDWETEGTVFRGRNSADWFRKNRCDESY